MQYMVIHKASSAPPHTPPRTMSLTFSHDVGDNTEEPSARNLIIRLCVLLIENTSPTSQGFSHLSRKRAQIFSFSPYDTTPYSTHASFNFSHMIYTVGWRTHTHTHTVPDVCRKLNQTLRFNSPLQRLLFSFFSTRSTLQFAIPYPTNLRHVQHEE